MAVTITCRCCNAVYKVGDDKRGLTVRCAKCQEEMHVPRPEQAVQSGSKLKMKSAAGLTLGDENERRPTLSRSPAESGFPMAVLVLGGLALLFMVLCGGGGIGAYFLFRAKPSVPDDNPERLAKVDIRPAIDNIEIKKKDDDPFKKKADDPIKKKADDPLKKKNDDPIKKKDQPVVDPVPLKPLPAEIAQDLLPRVKQATVYLQVTLAGGEIVDGSGFFAVEPGIIITNAYVVGMVQASSQAPKKVQVVLNSGEVNENQMAGAVLGVDPISALAVLRVNEGNLPAPLALETKYELAEAQKIYLAGLPADARMGKLITIDSSMIWGFEKHPETMEIKRVRVKGGLHAGNSGGPVVNSLGNLVGVAVAGVKGTTDFAIPAEKVRRILEGRVMEAKQGDAYVQGGQTLLPVAFTCLDPLQRIRDLRVEVWAGAPGPARPSSSQRPQALPTDRPRQSHAVLYQNGKGSLDVPLPTLAFGQVYWVQPLITTKGGATQWGTAQPTPTGMIPIERVSADLKISLTAQKERTVTLKSTQSETYIKGKVKEASQDKVEATMLEVLARDPKGAGVSTSFGAFKKTAQEDGKPVPVNEQLGGLMKKRAPFFIIDTTNKIQKRTDPPVKGKLDAGLRQELDSAYALLCNSLESATLPMPNRTVAPKEQWNATIPLTVRSGKKPLIVDLNFVCTYEGTRTRDFRREAVITIAGKVKGRGKRADKIDGDITGKIAFDMAGGYIKQAQLNISSDVEFPGEEKKLTSAFDIALNRQPGNPQSISQPPEYKAAGLDPDPNPFGPGPIMGKGRVVLNTRGVLGVRDAFDPFRRGSRMKAYSVKMVAGKTYVISLNSVAFDAFLRLESPKGLTIAQDDDSGGGLNARIIFQCPQNGVYRVIATSFNGALGPFQLLVVQDGGPINKKKR